MASPTDKSLRARGRGPYKVLLGTAVVHCDTVDEVLALVATARARGTVGPVTGPFDKAARPAPLTARRASPDVESGEATRALLLAGIRGLGRWATSREVYNAIPNCPCKFERAMDHVKALVLAGCVEMRGTRIHTRYRATGQMDTRVPKVQAPPAAAAPTAPAKAPAPQPGRRMPKDPELVQQAVLAALTATPEPVRHGDLCRGLGITNPELHAAATVLHNDHKIVVERRLHHTAYRLATAGDTDRLPVYRRRPTSVTREGLRDLVQAMLATGLHYDLREIRATVLRQVPSATEADLDGALGALCMEGLVLRKAGAPWDRFRVATSEAVPS